MATKSKKPPAARKTKGVDLTRLSQSAAAALIGKPAVWLRDNAHLFRRNADNTYDAHDVVRATQAQYRAADLTDAELEPVLQFCDSVADFAVDDYGAAARLIEGIEKTHGAAGLAAIIRQLLETLCEAQELYGEPSAETAEQIQGQADDKIRRIESVGAGRQYRMVLVCDSCRKHRWGRTWKSCSPPSGYATSEITCPDCEE